MLVRQNSVRGASLVAALERELLVVKSCFYLASRKHDSRQNPVNAGFGLQIPVGSLVEGLFTRDPSRQPRCYVRLRTFMLGRIQ